MDTRRIAMIAAVLVVLLCVVLGVGGITVYSAFNHEKPTVIINSPPSNSTYHTGDMVSVNSTSTDPSDIIRVDLAVDGTALAASTPPSPAQAYTATQTWQATAGTHTLTVIAYNRQNQPSDPISIAVTVLPAPAATATPTAAPVAASTATPAPTPTPAATNTPAPTATVAAANVCTNHAAFVTDVTVPDGTALAPGQAFNKIWRVRNSGTCVWDASYQFAFVSGDEMSAPTLIAVPATAPGATADLLVSMVASTQGGTHNGFWQMRTPNGTRFGALLNVTINVLAPIPPTGICFGSPQISSFTASPITIAQGQSTALAWGLVANANSADISGIGLVATPGSVVVTPSATTTYVLTGHCGSNIAQAAVTVNVVPAVASCFGTPHIASFGASPTTIARGQATTLFWGLVSNANYAAIDNDIGGIGTPGSTVVAPGSTTTYTLTAACNGSISTDQVTVNVVP